MATEMMKNKYEATYTMEDGSLCYIGGGETIGAAIEDTLWIIDMDGLDDVKTFDIRKDDKVVLSVEVA